MGASQSSPPRTIDEALNKPLEELVYMYDFWEGLIITASVNGINIPMEHSYTLSFDTLRAGELSSLAKIITTTKITALKNKAETVLQNFKLYWETSDKTNNVFSISESDDAYLRIMNYTVKDVKWDWGELEYKVFEKIPTNTNDAFFVAQFLNSMRAAQIEQALENKKKENLAAIAKVLEYRAKYADDHSIQQICEKQLLYLGYESPLEM